MTQASDLAYGRHPITNDVIAVKRGESGYWQTRPGTDPELRNKELGISEAEALALIEVSLGLKHYV
jgi:hypothetical protein